MASALLHGMAAFLRIYLLKRGFLDGWAGFVIALGNFEGTFYRYAKSADYYRRINDDDSAHKHQHNHGHTAQK